MVNLPDIYFLPEWGKSYEDKEQDGEQRVFELKNGWGHVYYQFILRTIPIDLHGETYYDIITPYGFSGPVILECMPDKLDELQSAFDDAFQKYCDDNKIVAEYIRFSPWIKNAENFKEAYEMRNQGTTIYIDLAVKDFFMDEFSSSTRRQVRRAQKNDVEIEFDFEGSTIGEFHRLYELTAKKTNMDEYYLFSKEFLEDSFRQLKDNSFLINALHEGKIVSSCLVVHHGDHAHYHLMANDPEYYHLAANSLIIYEACSWGAENNKKMFHLGGGGGDVHLDRFKRNFTKTEPLDFFVGKKVRNEAAYEELVEYKRNNGGIGSSGFFPLYRG
ncbi:GNAT family N-acetyltransferase [Planococcus sp. MERTA32b]|nr:GNAT family N-acetyltransferase [Planococcus sp. MER TA 32b]